MKNCNRLSPYIRMANNLTAFDRNKVAYRFSWQQGYEGPIALVRKYHLSKHRNSARTSEEAASQKPVERREKRAIDCGSVVQVVF
jgi:hypothetical protein